MNKEKLYTITQAARMAEIGRNKLLKLLRENGFLHSRESVRNTPTKRAVEQGLLYPKTTEFSKGPVDVQHITALVTPKGIVWICDLVEKQSIPKAS
ncbi:phage antirepressor KilAC domain-containing protein [Microbulbifer sp. TRSA002]|uniref:phage antirepressor KilAC domain-containing protein n=1 Tax=Microbulbifer sp. TRSA002 TaxID=3243382 RepID=UPI004039EF6C